MDLGLNGRNAVVCASSQGLGRACALELARAGCTVVVNGRHAETLERTAAEIRQESGGTVIAVAADVATPEGQEALLAAVPTVDILVGSIRVSGWRAAGRPTGLRARLCPDIWRYARIRRGQDSRAASPARYRGAAAARSAAATKHLPWC